MGNKQSNALSQSLEKLNGTVFVAGLVDAGKTTLLHKMEEILGIQDAISEIHQDQYFIQEKLSYNNKSLILSWDIGGSQKIRPFYKFFFKDITSLFFVVDGAEQDEERLINAKEEFYKLLEEEETKKWPILIFVNKKDLDDCRSYQKICELFDLNASKELRTRKWCICSGSADSGEGIADAFNWLVNIN